MTIQQLIDQLSKIPDKSQQIIASPRYDDSIEYNFTTAIFQGKNDTSTQIIIDLIEEKLDE
jgi:hypothetical protein